MTNERLKFCDCKEKIRAALIVVISGMSTGLFFWDAVHNLLGLSLPYSSNLLLILYLFFFPLLFICVWLIYSKVVSILTLLDFGSVLTKDAFSYLPFFILLLFPLRYPIANEEIQYSYLPSVTLIVLSISSHVAFKVFFIELSAFKASAILSFIKDRLVYFLIIVYIVVFATLSILRYNAFNNRSYDLAAMDNVVWNTAQGRVLYQGVTGNLSRLATHLDPILIFFAPFYWIYSDPRTLLFLQTVILALGTLPLYWLAKERFNSSFFALSISFAYLMFPALQKANLFNFHSLTIATPLLLYMFYYFQKKDYTKFAIFMVLSLMCREEISLVIFMLGLYMFLIHRIRRLGIIVSTIGILWFGFGQIVVIPYFRQGIPSAMHERYYSHLGDSFAEAAKHIILHPLSAIKKSMTTAREPAMPIVFPEKPMVVRNIMYQKIVYFVLLFLPVGFLCIFNLPILILTLPLFAVNFLSQVPSMWNISTKYASGITPFIFLSSIYGVSWLSRKGKRYHQNLINSISVFLILTSLLSNYLFGRSPISYHFDPKVYKVTQHDKVANEVIKSIPSGASVSAEMSLAPHLSQRNDLHVFPCVGETEYVVVDETSLWVTDKYKKSVLKGLKDLKSNENYQLIDSRDGIFLFKKRGQDE